MKKHDVRNTLGGTATLGSIDWLAECLGRAPHKPSPDEHLATMRSDLAETEAVVIFGAGSGGRRTYKELRARNVTVAHFIDNFATGDVDGIPIFTPQDAPDCDHPIILASTWFVDVYHQLTAVEQRYASRRIIPVPDCAFITMTIFDDMVGRPFFDVFDRRLADFQRVYELWDDDASRLTYARILAYRLGFFAPESLRSSDFPCPPDVYEQTAKPVPELPHTLDDGIKRAIAATFAHPHYWLDGFITPQPGDVVFDGGAWEGDTTYWYAQHCQPSGHIYAFEPSPFNFDRLSQNIEKMNCTGRITPVCQGLSSSPGEAVWTEMNDDAGTCSRISNDPNDGQRISLTSIDTYVQKHGLKRLDMIKMDLEGADFDALQGSKNTIAAFHPDLAISMYHKADHLVDIPLWILENFPEYRMRISHNHVGVNESICMATARGEC